jgi:two-component system sensor histidine kinase KdpD
VPFRQRIGGTASASLGVAVAVLAVAITTALVYPLKGIAPVQALAVVYLVAVLLVSSVWGGWLGIATALGSAMAFNFFHLPPTGRFAIREGQNWVALAVFLVAAVIVSTLAQRARRQAAEAHDRQDEADLAADLARLLLRGSGRDDALPAVSRRLAQALGLSSATIELQPVDSDERRAAFALSDRSHQIGTLILPSGLPEGALMRVRRHIVPALEALLAAALERDALLSDVVETSALRRSDALKTALLRTVSHDLRSPLTAILIAHEALGTEGLSDEEHEQLLAGVGLEATRLSRLIDNLLDLSRLEADAAEPQRQWCSIEEVIDAALVHLDASVDAVSLSVGTDLSPVRADAAQLERALANLLDNALRHSGGHPVSVRARNVGSRILIRIVDRGAGVPPADLERIFEPFYRSETGQAGQRGSGLGLAIARGFIEVNGGRVWAESLPGQGTSFVVELPRDPELPAAEQVSVALRT